jgi:GNAT superfamily N-acetyltransferase
MIAIRPMTPADLADGLNLSTRAGWNQTEADWRRFLDLQPDGCFLAEWNGTPAGTTTTCVLGTVAWIAMVLVEEPLRGRGIGKALMKHALEFLQRCRIPTVRLDATPLGQPLYEQLGFVPQYQLARLEGTLPGAPAVAGVTEVSPGQEEDLAALDEKVTGTDRRKLLRRLFAEHGERFRAVWTGNEVGGFMTSRPGSRAVMLGPCVASAEAGPLLLADACHRHAGERVFLDIPTGNEPAIRLAQAQGLKVQRHLLRMCRGPMPLEHVEQLWASSGPEKG